MSTMEQDVVPRDVVFLFDEVDEVDGVCVELHVTKQMSKFSWKGGRKIREESTNKTWIGFNHGTPPSGYVSVQQGEVTALVSLDPANVTSAIASTLAANVPRSTLIRWNGSSLVLKFLSEAEYEAFGDDFIHDRLASIPRFSVTDICAVTVGQPSLCYFEIVTNPSNINAIVDHTIQTLKFFSARFPYLSVHEEELSMDMGSVADCLPVFCLSVLFPGRQQSRASKLLHHLEQSPWKQVQFNKSLDGVTCSINKEHNGLLWMVQTGCVHAGVQLKIFVQMQKNFSIMCGFYESILHVKGIHQKVNDDIEQCTFGISSCCELLVVFYADVKLSATKNIRLCVPVASVPDLEFKVKLVSNFEWEALDPEGNVVRFVKLLE